MDFFGRQQELNALKQTQQLSQKMGRMTVITGRRRIGKTRLILESLGGQRFIYLFVTRKEERLLCADFMRQIKEVLDPPLYGEIVEFRAVFQLLIDISKQQHLNVVIDEFQEFMRINPSVYSEVQRIWDWNKDSIRMNLIFSGSVHSLMTKIFTNYQEPLFGRATSRFLVRPFGIGALKAIMQEFAPTFTAGDLLTLYLVTGGIPMYVEHFVDRSLLAKETILQEVFRPQSFFLEEGRYLLIQEFGKEYASYFSILSLIAAGKTGRSAIESILQKPTGGYLTRLEEEYQLIMRLRPMFSKPGTQNIRYFIDDNFLRFWFRFIFRYEDLIESHNFVRLRAFVDRDLSTYAGPILEKLIRKQLAESQQYSAIGRYWQRNGENEIDVIALNELTKQAVVGEVKMQEKNINIEKLKLKAEAIQRDLASYTVTYRGFSLDDILD
jgi:AAA+ ATPase superfamily predicted ATPase